MAIQLPQVRQFSGQVPDKAKMDKDTFANSVHTYLNYFNDNFVPDLQDWTGSFTNAQDEIQQLVDSGANIKQDVNNLVTLAKNYANADKDVEVETGFYSAKNYALYSKDYMDSAQNILNQTINYKDLAQQYANADENVAIEGQYYSAKHYMLKTQDIMNDAVAQLPEGTIDDSAVGTNTTWSSSKIDDEFKKRATAVIDGGNSNTAPDVYIDGGSSN